MIEIAEIIEFPSVKEWTAWLVKNHTQSSGIWLRLAKKSCERPLLVHTEALEAALCHGWIDAQKKGETKSTWLQRFTPRAKKSIWSKINCAKALDLIDSGRMNPAGLAEVERAQADGRWEAAYDSPRTATVPGDLAAAFEARPGAKVFFETLNSANRYAVLWRIQTTKTEITRKKRIGLIVEMLERKEKYHP
jgi:uncharacterized protein YdeI (YjbR/CyaY-like superfamily)